MHSGSEVKHRSPRQGARTACLLEWGGRAGDTRTSQTRHTVQKGRSAMAQTQTSPESAPAQASGWGRASAYDQWVKSIGIPIHKGYYQEDLWTVEVGQW